MKKLTINEFNLDLSNLKSKKLYIKFLQESLDNVESFKKLTNIEAYIQDESHKKVFSITQSFIEDFPHEKVKQIIKDFLLERKNNLLLDYESAIKNFKKKYENTGLDFSKELENLKN